MAKQKIIKLRILLIVLAVFISILQKKSMAQSFVHPGLLHSSEDIARMKKGVAEKQQPIFEGYEVFRENPQSQYTYQMQGPLASVGRNPTVGAGVYDADANAAYQNAIMWAITGDQRYADKSKEIVNAWSSTLKAITGRDAVLMAGLGPFKMVNAAEILRYTHSGWKDADIRQTEKHFKEVVYPVIKDFAPFANGNWDSAAMKTVMAIGIFCNDREIFERALRYYVNGAGDGRLTNYIINEEGQCQESGRDQQHTQLGLAHLGDCSEMAWHQGLDLYGYANNRLLKGFEYTAKYNLGFDVPYIPAIDRTGKYLHKEISEEGRGRFRPVYEQIYNHYANRMGVSAPFTQQVAARIRPEKQGSPGADHPGFGTLLYTRTAGSAKVGNTVPAPPAGLIAKSASSGNELRWIASVNAITYMVKRATKSGGTYTVIAKNIKVSNYTDKDVKPGRLYYYTVSAVDAAGESRNAYETGISAGLPAEWQQQDIGNVNVPGYSSYDGSSFTIEGAGLAIDSTNNQFQFAYFPLAGDGTITVRYVPQISSQFTQFGIMMRKALAAGAAYASLILGPKATGQIEAPGWTVKLVSRNEKGGKTTVRDESPNLDNPVITHGRLTGYYWLRLERKSNTFTGYGSPDGKTWTKIGSFALSLTKKLYAGLPVCSGLAGVTTRVVFDHVTVSGKR